MQDLPNQSEAEGELHYASVHFSKNQIDPVYSNIRPAELHSHKVEEDDVVEYAAVTFNSASTAPRLATLTVTLFTVKPQNDKHLLALMIYDTVFAFHTFIAVAFVCFVYIFTVTEIHTGYIHNLFFQNNRSRNWGGFNFTVQYSQQIKPSFSAILAAWV